MSRRHLRGALLVSGALVAMASASAGAVAHTNRTGPAARVAPHLAATGNAAAIAFYRKVVAATDAQSSLYFTYSAAQTLVRVKNLGGGRLSWLMADPPKAGYNPAMGAVWAGAIHGRTTFIAETVLPTSVADGYVSFELVLTPRGEVMLSPPSSSQACLGRTTGKPYVGLYTRTGDPIGYSLTGRFSPLRRVGDTVYVTSTYPWGAQTAIEVDTISATTYLPSRSVYHVLPHHGIPGFTFAQDGIKWGTTAPAPPVSTGLCATYLASIR